jgi:hypothetical protein
VLDRILTRPIARALVDEHLRQESNKNAPNGKRIDNLVAIKRALS